MCILNLIKRKIPFLSLIIFISCSKTTGFNFDYVYPQNLKVKKDSALTFYLKIKNIDNNKLILTNIKPSCKCIILSNKTLKLLPRETDSIRIKLFGSDLPGKYGESIIFTNNKIKKFKILELKYEVTN